VLSENIVKHRLHPLSLATVLVLSACGHSSDGNSNKAGGSATAGGPGSAGAQPGAAGTGAPGAGSGSATDRPVPVQTAIVKKEDLPIWDEGLGSVAAFMQVTVHTQLGGIMQKVSFTEGQTVKAGDVIAQIDPRPYLVALHQAQGALVRDTALKAAAQHQYERDLDMRKQNLIAQATVDTDYGQLGNYDGAVRMDQAQIESAQLNLDWAQIKAPLAGITGVRQVDPGNLVQPTDPNGIVVITAIDPVAVFFTITQDHLARVAEALSRGEVRVEVWTRDVTKKLGEGKVLVLDNQINQTTSTLRLKAIVNNPDRRLWPNEFVKARMLLETRSNAITVPAVALQHGPNGAYVYVVGSDGTAQMKPITVSDVATGDVTLVEKGLVGGEQVVTEGANQLRPGSHVTQAKAVADAASGASGGGGAAGGGAAGGGAAGGGAAGSGGSGGAGDDGKAHHGHRPGADPSAAGSGSGSGAPPAATKATAP
jgi:multidrug efflux system membrane fusion protein